MTRKFHHQHHTQHRSASSESTSLSLMAVQEVLGLFSEQQNHANHTLAVVGKPSMQVVLENKPLPYF